MPDSNIILALNSGSSSLKAGCFERQGSEETLVLTASADGIGRADGSLQIRSADGATLVNQQHVCESQEQALEQLATALKQHLPSAPIAVGHRIVHGGPKLREHQRITPTVIDDLQAAVHLAPLHIPQALALIRSAEKLFPDVPQIACFDTTFHRTMPDVSTHLPIPARFFAQGVQRYGFHGLSCESVLRRLGPTPPARLVIAHLGSGSSVTAVHDGKSVDTTMGLSPTGGIPMGTRSGDLDPGVLLYLLRNERLSPDALEGMLNHECGLAGLSGGEADMRALLTREANGDAAAALAIEAFCTAVRKSVGAYAALLGGLDLLVFTGGIGEHSEPIRKRLTDGIDFLFRSANSDQIAVLPTEEEAEIATHCRALLSAETPS